MLDESEILESTIHLREHLGLGPDVKIRNIEELIRDAGYHLCKEDFYNDFSGFTKYLGKLDYLIGYNTRHDWSDEFKRFTLAHELGHLSIPSHLRILHQKSMFVSSPGYHSDNDIEQEANIFAINFLAPPNIFKSELETQSISYTSLKKLSSKYKISFEATAIHMMNLTNVDAVFIVSNSEKEILYDARSNSFFAKHWHSSIKGNEVNKESNTYSFNENEDSVKGLARLKYWYPSIRNDHKIHEEVFNLGYQNRIGTFIIVEPN